MAQRSARRISRGIPLTHENKNLLLAISDSLLCEVTAFRLRMLGYGIHTVADINALVASLDEGHPNLLLMSVDLDDGPPTELLNSIRERVTSEEMPILLFSKDAALDAVRSAFHAGADDYLISPYDPAVLESKIDNLLESSKSSQPRLV